MPMQKPFCIVSMKHSTWPNNPVKTRYTIFPIQIPGQPSGQTQYNTKLDISGFVNHSIRMQSIKISSKVDEETWNELKALARETHRNVSGLLTEAIGEYVRRKRVRPEVLNHLANSMNENEELGKLLAK